MRFTRRAVNSHKRAARSKVGRRMVPNLGKPEVLCTQGSGATVPTAPLLNSRPLLFRGVDDHKPFRFMAGTTGLEPATSAVTGQRSNQLSYVPKKQHLGKVELIKRLQLCRLDPLIWTARTCSSQTSEVYQKITVRCPPARSGYRLNRGASFRSLHCSRVRSKNRSRLVRSFRSLNPELTPQRYQRHGAYCSFFLIVANAVQIIRAASMSPDGSLNEVDCCSGGAAPSGGIC